MAKLIVIKKDFFAVLVQRRVRLARKALFEAANVC